MGLDMYLTTSDESNCVAYWRKANAIHRWFDSQKDGGLEDCETMKVSKDMLKDLKGICDNIIEELKKEVPDLATFFSEEWMQKNWSTWKPSQALADFCSNVLPTQAGFFFGSTDYDISYFIDIRDTCEKIDKVLKEHPRCKFKYHAWW